MKLYEIDQAIMALVDEETGEIADFDALDALTMERDTKIENIACFIKDCVADATAIRTEEKALAERRGVLERRAERLKDYLSHVLNGEKFESARCSIGFRKTSSVQITDETAVLLYLDKHHENLLQYQVPKYSKTEIGKLLKSGEIVPGAEIVTGLSMGVK